MLRLLAFILVSMATFRAGYTQDHSQASPSLSAVHHDRIDLNVTHQTMESFAASDAWTMQKIATWSEENRNRIAELLFSTEKGIGLSCWRFNIGGGANEKTINDPWRRVETFEVAEGKYDWSRQANERWFLRAAKHHSVSQFLAFVNSPPGRMTRSGLTNSADDKTSPTNLKPGFEKQFARYLADILQHFRDHPEPGERISFDYISPVNEPQWDWLNGQEGNRASNDDLKRILIALSEELQTRGLNVQIMAPESGSIPDMYQFNRKVSERYKADFGDYVDVFASDPAVAPLLSKTLCYHSYWSDDMRTQLRPHREQLRKKLDEYPGWKAWQSEYCVMQHKRDLSMETAINVARIIHADLTVVNATAWHWWLAMSAGDYKDGIIFTDWKKPGDPETIIEPKLLWALGNYSRFIRPGMQRVGFTGDRHDDAGLFGSAYRDPKTGKLVVVYVNAGKEAQTVKLMIAGANKNAPTGMMFTPHVTSDHDSLQPKPAVDAVKGFEVPARSVVTLVSVR